MLDVLNVPDVAKALSAASHVSTCLRHVAHVRHVGTFCLRMTQSAYLFLGLTAVVAALVGLLAFAAAKFFAAARAASQSGRLEGAETAFMASAMEEAVRKLRIEERAMAARAEASERLSSEIIASMTSGLLVVGDEGAVRTLNPAARSILHLPADAPLGPFRETLG